MRVGRGGALPAGLVNDVFKRIINQLQEDSRRSYTAIGKAVGLSEGAVRQRMRKLVESGVMQIVAVIDPFTLGFARQAMIGIRADGDLCDTVGNLVAVEEIDYVVLCADSFDILVEFVSQHDDHLLSLVNDSIRMIPGVRSLKWVHLELGGLAPVIVFDTVGLAKAAEGIAAAGYFNVGQDCTAASRHKERR
jgi:Lrp/AsnC family transcriptional regulator for asnA, asnC and gidA